jgi:predicted  nucleic acid-binding Zn-ribbon protein
VISSFLNQQSPSKIYKEDEEFWRKRSGNLHTSGGENLCNDSEAWRHSPRDDDAASEEFDCQEAKRTKKRSLRAVSEQYSVMKAKVTKLQEKFDVLSSAVADAERFNALKVEHAQMRDVCEQLEDQVLRLTRHLGRAEERAKEEVSALDEQVQDWRSKAEHAQQMVVDIKAEYDRSIADMTAKFTSQIQHLEQELRSRTELASFKPPEVPEDALGPSTGDSCTVLPETEAVRLLSAQNAELRAEVDQLRRSIPVSSVSVASHEYQRLIVQLKNAHRVDMDAMRDKYEATLARLRDDQGTHLNTLKADCEYQIYMLNEKHKTEMDDVRAKLEFELLRVSESIEEQEQRLRIREEQIRMKERDLSTVTSEEFRKELDRALQRNSILQAQIDLLEAELVEKNEMLRRLQEHHSAVQYQLQDQERRIVHQQSSIQRLHEDLQRGRDAAVTATSSIGLHQSRSKASVPRMHEQVSFDIESSTIGISSSDSDRRPRPSAPMPYQSPVNDVSSRPSPSGEMVSHDRVESLQDNGSPREDHLSQAGDGQSSDAATAQQSNASDRTSSVDTKQSITPLRYSRSAVQFLSGDRSQMRDPHDPFLRYIEQNRHDEGNFGNPKDKSESSSTVIVESPSKPLTTRVRRSPVKAATKTGASRPAAAPKATAAGRLPSPSSSSKRKVERVSGSGARLGLSGLKSEFTSDDEGESRKANQPSRLDQQHRASTSGVRGYGSLDEYLRSAGLSSTM